MSNHQKISIVIPLYNKAQSITHTLDSVLAQTYTDYEVVVVNDGSTDGSGEVVEQYIKDNPQSTIHLISKANGGVSSARNVGIRAAKSDYVALLDGDDIWEPTFLEEQVRLIQDFPNAGIYGVNYAFIKGNTCTKCNQGLGDGYRGYVENYWTTSHNDLYCSNSVVIPKHVFEQLGYFDERIHYSEDLDMWYRIILHYPIVFYDKVLAYYNQNAENRCAYDLHLHHDLAKCFEYFIGKYDEEFNNNRAASHYISTRVAADILRNDYYFGSKDDRKKSDELVKDLHYQDIHPKYRFIFKTPRWLGRIIYKIVCLKKNVL